MHCLDIVSGHATPDGTADGGQICHGSAVVAGLFQPTFLYESVWNISLALILIWISRRWRSGSGQLFAIYVMGYTAGRGWIEALRHDHANHILGLRLNLDPPRCIGGGRVVERECPCQAGESNFSRGRFDQLEGHLVDATISCGAGAVGGVR